MVIFAVTILPVSVFLRPPGSLTLIANLSIAKWAYNEF